MARGTGGSPTLTTEELEALIDRRGEEIALILLGAVNYYTGQAFDLERIVARAREKGCIVGLDLAHAVGNLELDLHAWQVDFGVWCSYKYLNAGPGAVGGCFVHEDRAKSADLPRFGGWWGTSPETRFRMHLEREFVGARDVRADSFNIRGDRLCRIASAHLREGLGHAGHPPHPLPQVFEYDRQF